VEDLPFIHFTERVEGRRSWRFSLPEQLYNRVGEDKRILFPWGTSDADPNELLKLGRKLDDSSLGAVYKATAKETGFVVAVKIMPLQSQAMREEIVHEVNGLERARHPNVVRYYGSLIAEDSIWVSVASAQF
jgi:serine/threonine protein kinase